MVSFSALCLTSKRLSTIATPFLHTDLVTTEKEHSKPRQLSQVLRVITQRPHLATHIGYVEHILTDRDAYVCAENRAHEELYTSNTWSELDAIFSAAAARFWNGDFFETWKNLLQDYPEMAQLALLLEPFFRLLSAKGAAIGQHTSAVHGIEGLEKIFVNYQEHLDQWGPPRPWYTQFLRLLQSLPVLRHYAHDELALHSVVPEGFYLAQVDTLLLEGCCMDFQFAASIIRACGKLKHLKLYPKQDFDNPDFSALYPHLEAKKDTLESLELSVGEMFNSELTPLRDTLADFNVSRICVYSKWYS
ncbi:hypothetical protein EK21DRAFT_111919 [Setomelanomma holmii]|uniref:Uncharacterized protein n=1 Tax=Setomelanomma holmii TaxID=210430 RepID=A0A9P4HC49_9PLEO|nr:hypothetical protein EK21DRAFT_111919 [Setomelanomma holmii]